MDAVPARPSAPSASPRSPSAEAPGASSGETPPDRDMASTRLIGLAADHGGFELKTFLAGKLRNAGFRIADHGAHRPDPGDDYPDFVVPMAQAVARGELRRGIAVCGSGVGVCVAANKVAGVRACAIHDSFAAHQGVEDDDLNVLCLGGQVVGQALAWELVRTFLAATFTGAERHRRRLAKLAALEPKEISPCKQTD